MAEQIPSSHLNDELFAFETKNCCNTPKARRILFILYDIFSFIVSLLDLITDIIVLINFYILGRMTFFYASLSILLLAQLLYVIVFMLRFSKAIAGWKSGVIIFVLLLPFAPILSIILYFAMADETCLATFIEQLFENVKCDCTATGNSHLMRNKKKAEDEVLTGTKFKQWILDKIMDHFGFIIEAVFEAFPQSVLQLIAIVHFKENDNYISMLSILLSLLSISSKTFIATMFFSYSLKSALFKWISAITDFFAVFVTVSLIFYSPQNLLNGDVDHFQHIRDVYMYYTLLTVLPSVAIISVGLNAYFIYLIFDHVLYSDYDWKRKPVWTQCVGICAFVVLFQIAWIIGVGFGMIIMSILCFAIFAVFDFVVSFDMTLDGNVSDFYLPLMSFIKKAKGIIVHDDGLHLEIAKSQHQAIRGCCVNRVLIETKWGDKQKEVMLKEYLIKKSKLDNTCDYSWPYSDVRLKDIKLNSAEVWLVFAWNESKELCRDLLSDLRRKVPIVSLRLFMIGYMLLGLFFVMLYLFGRVFQMFFILYVISYLSFGHAIYIFSAELPLFQSIMCVANLILVLIWILLLCLVLMDQYYISFILPSTQTLYEGVYKDERETKTKEIMTYYHWVISQPVIRAYCVNLFGKDIAVIIIKYFADDHYQFVTE